jgi:hypothetical protein
MHNSIVHLRNVGTKGDSKKHKLCVYSEVVHNILSIRLTKTFVLQSMECVAVGLGMMYVVKMAPVVAPSKGLPHSQGVW